MRAKIKLKTVARSSVALALILAFITFSSEILSASQIEEEKERIKELSEMTIEDLMNVEVKIGVITDLKTMNAPASITTINREEILTTPARDILDLIEIYVPGASFVFHFNGPRFGMRGVLGDQNYSFLLLVNGRNMNMKTVYGPFFEIQNRDLGDIEKIEIIRGPGSVTYGPGAIGGIINIVTRRPRGINTFETSADYDAGYRIATARAFGEYSSGGINASFYGSVCKSEGLENVRYYYIDRARGYGYGLMDWDWGNKELGTAPPEIYNDYLGVPQAKLQVDVEYGDSWRLWARYNNFSHSKVTQENRVKNGYVYAGITGKAFTAQLENKTAIDENATLTTDFAYSSKSSRDRHFYQGVRQVFDHISQRNWSFSENEIFLRSLLNAKFGENLELAAGVEAFYQYLAPEWGMGEEDFILGFQYPIRFAVLSEDSRFRKFYGDVADGGFTTVIDNIDGWSFSLFGEANWRVSDFFTALLSARVDKHVYSDLAVSPRVALIADLDKKNTIKAIGQRSTRLPNFTDLFSEDWISGGSAEPETLNGFELIYSRLQTNNLSFNVSGYYYFIQQMSWLSEELQAGLIGEYDVIGAEAEIAYRVKENKFGLNYSFMNQLSWTPKQEYDAFLSNMGADSLDVELGGGKYGENRVNNLPTNALKAFARIRVAENFFLRVDGRAFWDYGQNDMLDVFLDAHNQYGDEETKSEMNAIYDDLKKRGYGEASFAANLSLAWKINLQDAEATLSLFARNFLSINNLRYIIQFWEYGDLRQYPRQVSFIEEPATIGMGFRINFD